MLFSEVSGRKIVSTTTADTVGKVDDFVVDPATHTVVAFRVKKADSGDALEWGRLTAVGQDAVTVDAAEAIAAAEGRVAELIATDNRTVGKLALSTAGDELGKVADVEFDPADGVVTLLRVGEREVAGSDLVGIGSYAVVVRV